MNKAVSIIMKDCNVSNSFFEANRILVFLKGESGWTVSKEIPMDFKNFKNLASLRTELVSLSKKLGECGIIAGKEISGLPFTVFDSLGFHIFFISELNDCCLDGMLEDVNQNNKNKEIPQKPIETSTPGKYYFDLAALQEKFPEISSKKALRQFFEEIPFLELELVCAHLPPWIESLDYDITFKKQNEKTIAIIKKKSCGKEML
ncbi:MAG: hypothetical protein N2Z57_01420 [Oscillospiraceae bacterium]|nr:hypothetical protein [Oscillospiraceae bacterium]